MPKYRYLFDFDDPSAAPVFVAPGTVTPVCASQASDTLPKASKHTTLAIDETSQLTPPVKIDETTELARGFGFVGTFLLHTQFGTLQYVFVKTLCSALMLICTLSGKGGDEADETSSQGFIKWDRADIYLGFLTNVSQIWAMFCLVVFYLVCKEDLKAIRPLFKFAMVKAVVFLTFWQSLVLLLFSKVHLLWPPDDSFSDTDVLSVVSNFLLCLEMLLAACAHIYAFPAGESYLLGERPLQTVTLLPVLPVSLPVEASTRTSTSTLSRPLLTVETATPRQTAKTDLRSLVSVFNMSDIQRDASHLRRHSRAR
jgi:hypothetical protein